ncbi:MAG: diaminopimelate decarboxylase [Deltaproteobacteria bacterium]|nr:diaminopimelate decarboxylase [Deltaproteobacteria bacterium]MBI4795324.1 diaminopimelate decarboxylase [Deltaproteobacteria bacterium]
MHHFHYQNSELYCEGVPVKDIAARVGTPFYLYSSATLSHHYRVFDGAFEGFPHVVCFAVKANANLAILRLLARQGAGADIVSGGELHRALKAGVDPAKIVYSGVGKRPEEIRAALKAGILLFNLESSQELGEINRIAGRLRLKARVGLRINPDIDPRTHPYISTGLKKNKFGIDIERAYQDYLRARELPHLEVIGVACHIGSQITEVEPFVDALERLKELIHRLEKAGIPIRYLDLGGGLGIRYDQEEPPHPHEYGGKIVERLRDLKVTLILEPGRVLVGNAGILVTKVLYTKESKAKNFIIVDAGMNDLARPSLYGSYHGIRSVVKRPRPRVKASLVGPICESGDFLAKDREMAAFQPGELVAVMSAGAYGFSMSSNYNARPRVAEILVQDQEFYVIRKRETYRQLVWGENIPEFLK